MMNVAASETRPRGEFSTGTGKASATIAASSSTPMPARLPPERLSWLSCQTAAPSAAYPASVTGRNTGNSQRVSREKSRSSPSRAARPCSSQERNRRMSSGRLDVEPGADEDEPEEAVRRSDRRHRGQDQRQSDLPVQHR